MLLSDPEIAALLAEQKPEVDPGQLLRVFSNRDVKDGHRRYAITVHGAAGTQFQLALRQSIHDPYDFSVILTLVRREAAVNLRRHNGTSHAHFNPIEGDRFRGVFHVHEATERYQQRGSDPEHYARQTSEFYDLATALTAMLRAATFHEPSQLSLDPT